MDLLPAYISINFIAVTCATVALFCKSAARPLLPLVVIVLWLFAQGIISSTGFYTVTDGRPPRFPLLLLPPMLFMLGMFLTRRGKRFVDGLDLRTLTALHVVRIPVELVLFWLYKHRAVPKLMTFDGFNFDILSGISALPVLYFGWAGNRLRTRLLLVWNIICLILLLNIVILAVLSTPLPFQQLAFDQPDVALLYFPFVWLPCCVVPLVLLSHLAAIRQLIAGIKLQAKPAAR